MNLYSYNNYKTKNIGCQLKINFLRIKKFCLLFLFLIIYNIYKLINFVLFLCKHNL